MKLADKLISMQQKRMPFLQAYDKNTLFSRKWSESECCFPPDLGYFSFKYLFSDLKPEKLCYKRENLKSSFVNRKKKGE